MTPPRQIRIFLSSTFRDMQAERDHLLKFVFPQLRKLCESRDVIFDAVDLRWGITIEQARQEQTLALCLEEIRRCQPFFIGLLGERYGWVPSHILEETIERQSWLRDYKGRSVTELEIVHGVLRQEQMHGRAFFYFRDPGYLDRLAPGAIRSDFESESPESALQLGQLKQRIRVASGKFFCRLQENYQGPEQLGEWLLDDFHRLIDDLFPADQKPGPLDREAMDHMALAQSRARVYIGRQDAYSRLDAHAASQGPPLVILGDSGCGKSALLANWALRYQAAHPDDFLLIHFVGATPYSADWTAMVRRIMGEFKRRFGIAQEIPGDAAALRAAFANWMNMAAAKGRVILIFDGLDQLEDRDGAPDLTWLPPVIPGNLRVFLSTLPGRSLDELQKRGWPTLEVNPLNETERRQLIAAYLAERAKALDQFRVDRLAHAPQSANPLFLRALMDELCVFGSHEKLDAYISDYLEAATPVALYERILARWEADYGQGSDLVRDVMTILWAARRGVSESELLDMLGTDGLPLPQAHWSPLHLAAEQALVNRSGLLGFSHAWLRQAVRDRYLSGAQQRVAAHRRVGDYFGEQPCWLLEWKDAKLDFQVDGKILVKGRQYPNLRRVDEQPWQLSESEAWPELAVLLTDRSFLPLAWDHYRFDLQTYWARIETSSPIRMVDAYRPQFENPRDEADNDFQHVVALVLEAGGHNEEALAIWSALVARYAAADDAAQLRPILYAMATTLIPLGKWDDAMAAYQRAEKICLEQNDKEALSKCLGGQGLILQERGAWDAAMALHQQQERICREQENQTGLAVSLNNQAMILVQQGKLEEAMAHYREEEQICRFLGDLDGQQHSLGGQATVLKASGHLDGVMNLYKQQADICRRLGDQQGVAISLGNQALVLQDLENWNGAMKLHREEERIFRYTGYRKGLAICLTNQISTLWAQDAFDAALDLFEETERIWRQLGAKSRLNICLSRHVDMLAKRGRFGEALTCSRQREEFCRETGNPRWLADCLGYMAAILRELGDLEGMAAALREQEQISRQLGDIPLLASALITQAQLAGDAQKGVALAQQAFRMVTDNGFPELAEQIRTVQDRLMGGR